MRSVLFVIRNIGSYHVPRLLAAQTMLERSGCALEIVELQPQSAFYRHDQSSIRARLSELTVYSPKSATEAGKCLEVLRLIAKKDYKSVFVLGYNSSASLCALLMSKIIGCRIYFCSDSKADDQRRSILTEFLKKIIVRTFDGALVAGERHAEYFVSLGMKRSMIETGYDVIDNEHVSAAAASAKSALNTVGAPRELLVVSRLVSRKRIDRAIDLFRTSGLAADGYRLIVVGDGPERTRLNEHIERQGLMDHVQLIGSVPSVEMPSYYARASALILASEYDQWGLCVNEAMACGVPALLTARCGAANELVEHRSNGFVWDGDDLIAGADMLRELVVGPNAQHFATSARQSVSKWGLDRFARSLTTLACAERS